MGARNEPRVSFRVGRARFWQAEVWTTIGLVGHGCGLTLDHFRGVDRLGG